MNSTKHLMSLSTALLCAAAIGPATAAAADVERGSYSGSTSQAASGDAKAYSSPFKISLGRLSDPARVMSVELTARLRCDDGSTRDVSYDKVILGPKLNRKHRFVHRDGGLELRGRFGTKGKARGTFSYRTEDCSVVGASWSAANR